MRPIDADALVRIVQQSVKDAGLHFEDSQKFLRWLRKAPTIDAVPVVRCRDCVNHDKCYPEEYFLFCGIDDGYCRIGKRIGGEPDDDSGQ